MDIAESRRAPAATTSNTANDAAIDGKLFLENNAPFTNYISTIYDVLVDNTEDLYVVMPMYNLLEYSNKLRKKNRKFVELLHR